MEEELVMIRQFIGQLQELLHNDSPPPSSSSSFLVLHNPQYQNHLCWTASPARKEYAMDLYKNQILPVYFPTSTQ
ncbi:unnamed protein product [Cochlearia groenlandica]